MIIKNSFREVLEQEERNTVSDAFGGVKVGTRAPSFSVTRIQRWLLAQDFEPEAGELDALLHTARRTLPADLLQLVVKNIIRYAFLIELTNLTVGSTKMKTRWLPGSILMPQPGSFTPIQGQFVPGNDPRAASFEDCLEVFKRCLLEVITRYSQDTRLRETLIALNRCSSVPYEFVFDYINPSATPVHTAANIQWALNEDCLWLIRARPIMRRAFSQKLMEKLQTKTYKTDRSLTGKDKTNRAKRWEVLAGDFQHASLTQCWSVEKQLLRDLVGFEGFPHEVHSELVSNGLLPDDLLPTRCPVTLDVLIYDRLGEDPTHGRAEYQVGHLIPLKKGGSHQGDNVRWQSADGNRIQGDLSIEETVELLEEIAARRLEHYSTDLRQSVRTGTR